MPLHWSNNIRDTSARSFRVKQDKISDVESELKLFISMRLPKIKINGETWFDINIQT